MSTTTKQSPLEEPDGGKNTPKDKKKLDSQWPIGIKLSEVVTGKVAGVLSDRPKNFGSSWL